MRVFDGTEMEFFDVNKELPDHQEEVVVIIKAKAPSRWKDFPETLTFCTAHIYKKTPPRFAEISEHGFKMYRKEDIKCWGRLIKS